MASDQDLQTNGPVLTHEEYGPGYRRELIEHHNTRTAVKDAGFLMPFLKDGQDILDCGCGKGSITLGIAANRPGARVVGCDIGAKVLEEAGQDAIGAGLTNASFQVGSIYDLPFPDQSFDAIIAHAVFQHLARPEAALSELDRVLRPGGVIGLRDDDRGSMVLAPEIDGMDRAFEVMDWFMLDSSGDPFAGRKHRDRLHRLGYIDIIGSATCEADGTPQSTRHRGDMAAAAFRGKLGRRAVEAGICSEEECERLAVACETWGNHPAAFDCITWCEAVGTKPLVAGDTEG